MDSPKYSLFGNLVDVIYDRLSEYLGNEHFKYEENHQLEYYRKCNVMNCKTFHNSEIEENRFN